MKRDKAFIGYGLHDAALERIEVDWLTGEAKLHLDAGVPVAERVIIHVHKLVEVSLARRQPWGTSGEPILVNDVRLATSTNESESRLEIELGGGDVLIFIAGGFSRTSAP